MTVTLELKDCRKCPFLKEGPTESTDDFDSGNDWICTKANKKVAGFVEWHEVNKTPIPDWCPIKSNDTTKDALIKELVEFLTRVRPNLVAGSRNKIDALIAKTTKQPLGTPPSLILGPV